MEPRLLYDYNNGDIIIYTDGYKLRHLDYRKRTMYVDSIKIYDDFILWVAAETTGLIAYVKKTDTIVPSVYDTMNKHIVYNRKLYVFGYDIYFVCDPEKYYWDVCNHVNIVLSNDPFTCLVQVLDTTIDKDLIEEPCGVITRSPMAIVCGFLDITFYHEN